MGVMCRLYGVSRAGYYAWRARGQSVRAKADEQLWEHIERIYQASGGTYGSPRIHAALKAQGSGVGKKRVERSMRKHGLRARSGKTLSCQSG
jgi:putative transposase